MQNLRTIPSAERALTVEAAEPAVLRRLLEIGKLMLAESDVDRILTMAVDDLIAVCGAEGGMIVFFHENGEILFETARTCDQENLNHPELEISRALINKVRNEGAPIFQRGVHEDRTLPASENAAKLRALSLICLPLCHEQEVFGLIYLYHRTASGKFSPEKFQFVESFARFISMAAHCARERKRLHNHVQALEAELRGRYHFEAIVGHHPRMAEILRLVAQIADTDATILIQGESGTGKELIARALHLNSSRRHKPFVPINCGAFPESLLESELFGYVRGAFTGATQNKPGWFERAHGGTIFLDEISDMTPALQVKLLRILQTGEYTPLGSTEIRRCELRVVAATNKDLEELVKAGKFREDVFYRLNVIRLELPALRERRSDIPLLAQHFIQSFGAKYGKTGLRLSLEAEKLLLSYDFPGNVRELENIIQRAVLLAESQTLEAHHLPPCACQRVSSSNPGEKTSSFRMVKRRAVEKFEREYLSDCLVAARGNITRAARFAGLHVKNFHDKMKKYGLEAFHFK